MKGMRGLILITLLAAPAYARDVVECSDHRGPDPRWWSWREVDGRKCWYVGPPNKPKSELYWRAPESLLRGAQVQRRAEPSHPQVSASPVSAKEVMSDGRPASGDQHNAPPAPVDRDELMARAMTNLVLLGQERLRERAPDPEPFVERAPEPQRPLPAAPRMPVHEQMPIWQIALIFLLTMGIAFALPLLRRPLWRK